MLQEANLSAQNIAWEFINCEELAIRWSLPGVSGCGTRFAVVAQIHYLM